MLHVCARVSVCVSVCLCVTQYSAKVSPCPIHFNWPNRHNYQLSFNSSMHSLLECLAKSINKKRNRNQVNRSMKYFIVFRCALQRIFLEESSGVSSLGSVGVDFGL